MPKAARSPFEPAATTTPPPTPMAEATKPTMSASASTDRVTCFRLAPRARRSASSRSRWATMIVKVLKMMNEPTNRATAAKASRKVLKKPSASLTSPAAWAAATSLVTASRPCGRTA